MEPRQIAVAGGHVSAAIALPAGFVPGSAPAVVLGHGAGSDMRNPFLVATQTGLADAGYPTVTFNFPYREAGKKIPDARPVLERCWRSVGGRMATYLAAARAPIDGLVLLGYPLHPAGRPDALRADHLAAIQVPM